MYGNMYLVKIGILLNLFLHCIVTNRHFLVSLVKISGRSRQKSLKIIHFKSISRRLYTKWHRKFSLWKPFCVTQTSL